MPLSSGVWQAEKENGLMDLARWKYGLFAIAAGLLGACAHEKPAPVAQAPAPQPVAAPSPAPKVEQPKPKEDIALALKAAILHFDFDRDFIKPESEESLQKLSGVLERNPEVMIQVQGNCDERGTEEYNLHLGMRRATSAKQYLVGLGIDGNRIDTISYGFERPVDPRHNEQAWAANRRDDFVRTQNISTR